jgi:peptidylprolyl isomerase
MKMKYAVLLCIALIAAISVIGCGEEKSAADGDTVSVHYTGTLNDGSQFDSSIGKDPLVFVLGAGNMISGFENAVRGMKVGESKTVTLSPDEAYGQHREELIATVNREELPEGMVPEVGRQLQITSEGGSVIVATITEVSEDTITLDANHRLAGKELTFEIELVELEPAD